LTRIITSLFYSLVHAQTVVALITADVHNRDVVMHLMEGQCHCAADFAWQRQLRYEYDGDVDTVVIRQVNARCVSIWTMCGKSTES
jgi:dynein heavy chain